MVVQWRAATSGSIGRIWVPGVGLLRKLSLLLLLVLLLGGVALSALWWFLDPSDYTVEISQQATAAVGHPVRVEGGVALALLPKPAIQVEKVTLANAEGFRAPAFAEAREVVAAISPMSLARGRLVLEDVRAGQLALNMEQDSEGASNWRQLLDTIQARNEEEDGFALTFSGLRRAQLDGVRVDFQEHGEAPPWHFELRDLLAKDVLADHEATLSADWSGDLGGIGQGRGRLDAAVQLDDEMALRRIELKALQADLTLGAEGQLKLPLEIEALLELDSAAETASLTGFRLSLHQLFAELEAQVQYDGDQPEVTGTFTVADDLLRETLRRVTGDDPETKDPDALGLLHLQGGFRYETKRLTVSDLTARLDDTRLEAYTAIAVADDPLWEFDITVDQVDLDRYGGREEFDPEPAQRALGVILDELAGMGVDGSLAIGALKTNGLELTEVSARAHSEGDTLEFVPLQASLYGGNYHGELEVTLTDQSPRFSFDQRLESINLAEPFEALLGRAFLDSEGHTRWRGSFNGLRWPEIRDSLEAEGELYLRDGTINGFDLQNMIEDAVPEALGSPDKEPFGEDASTVFSSVSGEFTAANGKLDNAAAKAVSEHFSVVGEGALDMKTGELGYKLELTLVESFQTESEELLQLLDGVTLPLNLHGPLVDLEVEFDFEGLLDSDEPGEHGDYVP